MTQAQVIYSLGVSGASLGEWLTLEGIFRYISLRSDKTIFLNPKAVQVFFSNIGEYLLVRYTNEDVTKTNLITPPDGYVFIYHNNEKYLAKLRDGGKIDNSPEEAGLYHDIIALDSISGIHYK